MASKQFCVVDTSAWIEWLIDSHHGKKLSREFPAKDFCIVPTIVQLELSKWLTGELGEDRADSFVAYTQKCIVAPLKTDIALLAAEFRRKFKLATADAIVYATAQNCHAELITFDAHFAKLPAVTYLAK